MTEEKAISIVEQGAILPTPALARDMMDTLQGIMQAVLDDSDYAVIQGKKWRKRSGFTKLRRAFDITIKQLDGEWEVLGDGVFGYRALVRASFPNGRYEDGDGYCDSSEMSRGRIEATRHNVRAKALTRAKNRATADLLGTGEVSADELTPYDYHEAKQPQPQPQQAKAKIREPGKDPQPPEVVRAVLRKRGGWIETDAGFVRNVSESVQPSAQDTRQHVVATLSIALAFDGATDADIAENAKLLLNWLYGVETTAQLSELEGQAIKYAWLKADGALNEYAKAEAIACLEQALEEVE